ncbi:MAG TPA: hypothetical protein VIH90_07660 [Candidatus Saccharimonadales bacterium]|jgi:hypothetical protein
MNTQYGKTQTTQLTEARKFLIWLTDDYHHPIYDSSHPKHKACYAALRQLEEAIEAATLMPVKGLGNNGTKNPVKTVVKP